MPELLKTAICVLIVDGDAASRKALRSVLSSVAAVREVLEAESAAQALELLATRKIDAVLIDLPLAERLPRPAAVPMILLSDTDTDPSVEERLADGAVVDFLPKARLSADLLSLSLRHVLQRQQMWAAAVQVEGERGRLLEHLAAEQGRIEAILNSMTDGLVVSDLAGNILVMNPAALAMHGYESLEEARLPLSRYMEIFDVRSLDGSTLQFPDWPLSRAVRGEKFSHREVVIRRRETGRAWIGSYSGTPVLKQSGEAILAIVTIRDVTQAKQVENRAALLAEAGAQLSASLDAQTTLETIARFIIPTLADWCAVNALDSDGLVRPLIIAHAESGRIEKLALPPATPLNQKAAYGIGYVLRTGLAQLIPEMTQDAWQAEVQDDAHRVRLLSTGARSYLCVPLTVRGEVFGSLSLASTGSARLYDAQDLALATELGRRVAAGLENARLFEDVRARAERETLINEIGRTLRVSLDNNEILLIVTEHVGVALNVSRCRFLGLNPVRDTLNTAAPQYAAFGIDPAAGSMPLTDWPAEVVDQWIAGQSVSVSENGLAWIGCPIFLRGQFGGVFLVEQLADFEGTTRIWNRYEESFLSAVTDILALALENARLYAREHRVADMLTSAFLTDIPDLLPGLALAANYRAGLEEAQVGGDYYDAFALPDGRVAVVIADVSGKGLSAAVQTATVKYSLRAFATESAAPRLVLSRLNRMLCSELAGLGDHFVTLFYAVFDPASGRLAWGSAGHESVLIKRAAGGSSLLEANGPILGLAEHSYEQETAELGPGDSLILYTDGLTEARQRETRALLDIDGVRTLVESLPAEAGPGVLASALQRAALQWTGGRPQDDMALLVIRRQAAELPADGPDEEADRPMLSWDEGDELFEFHFPSRADYVTEVRQALGHWMPMLGFDRAATEDFQTAVTEAVTNAVRHGSPAGSAAEFHVLGRRTSAGSLRVEVTDTGFGLPTSETLPSMPGPDALGGRGLPLMRELSDSLEFRPAPLGLCVVLIKQRPPSAL